MPQKRFIMHNERLARRTPDTLPTLADTVIDLDDEHPGGAPD
jgi:hypothetical protein